MNRRFSILAGLLLVVTACGKAPEEKQIETIEVRGKSAQNPTEEFVRIFSPAIFSDPNSPMPPSDTGLRLTILDTWLRDLPKRTTFLNEQADIFRAGRYEGAKAIYQAIEEALQGTATAQFQADRYVQLYNEVSHLKAIQRYDSAYRQKLAEADTLLPKLELSAKTSGQQERALRKMLENYSRKQRVGAES